MRSFWRILFGKRPTQHPDTFALTRSALWGSIAESIKLQQSMGKSVWLVAHFPGTYTDCQAMLESHDIDYFVETEPISESWFREHAAAADPHVRLLIADLLKPLEFEEGDTTGFQNRIALMVAERHPWGPRDERVLDFADSLPTKVEVGYFMALDDELVKRMVPPQMIELMKTMGLQEHDLISSSMVTKRLRKLIHRLAESGDREGDEAAESAAEWFEIRGESS